MNDLITKFIFDSADDLKVDLTKKNIIALNTEINKLGVNPTFGNKFSAQFDNLNESVNQFDSNLKKLNDTDLTGKGLKDLSSEMQKQAQAQKAIEQAKQATIHTSITEVKLEREKIGLQRESLALQTLQNKLRNSAEFGTSGKSAGNLKNEINDSVSKPTISRYWENEEKKTAQSLKTIEDAVSKTTAAINKPLTNPGADSHKRISQAGSFIGQDNKEQNVKPFAESYKSAFSDIESRSKKTLEGFQKLKETKLNKGQFDIITQGAIGAEAKVNSLTKKIRELKKESADPSNAQYGKLYAQGLREAETELAQFEAKLSKLNREQKTPSVKKSNSKKSESENDFSLKDAFYGLSAIVGISQFISTSQKAIEISKESVKANRLLASSATEIGLAYGELAEKNKKFADQNALSLTQSAATTAQIARLSGGTGKPQNIDKYLTAFSDLSAARGIDPNQLESLVGSILSGSDESLNRLNISDPGKLYETYARKLGTTAEKLTQFQKAQAIANAVVEKSEIFKGAAQTRLESFEGRTASLSAKVDNLATSFSNSFTQSYEFNSALEISSKFVKNLTQDVDELQRKIALGIKPTDKDFSDAAKPNFLSDAGTSVERGFFRFMAGFAKIPKYLSYGTFDPFAESSNKFAENAVNLDPEYQKQYREDFIRQQYHAQLRLNALQKTAAEDQQKYYKELEAKDAEREKSLAHQSELQRILSNPYTTLSGLRDNRDRLRRGDLFGRDDALTDSDKQKLTDDFDKAVSQGVSKGFSRTLQSSKEDLGKLRQSLNQVLSSSELLPDDRESLVFSYEQQIKSLTEQMKLSKAEFNTFSAESASPNNQFVKFFADVDSAGERMEKRFKTLGDEYVKLATVIERNNIAKKINELKFSNDLSALKITQDIRRTDQLPNNQRFEFTRGLENLNQISDFALNFSNLSRKLAEANFYSDKYNPNNPKSFAEYNRRGIRDDISETGLQVRFAAEDIRRLNSIDLQGTSIYGQGAIADKILSIIPSRDELLRRLNNPLTRNEAQYLLNQQSNSLSLKRDFETQKFNDFFEQQKYSDLRRIDAREQLDLLKNSTGLDKEFANQQFLKITDELGVSNLSKDLLQGRRDAQQEAVKILQEQFREAKKEAENSRRRNEKLETFLDVIVGQLKQNGLKIDASDLPGTNVVVNAKNFETQTNTGAAGTQSDVDFNYDNIREGFANSFGGYGG